MLLGRWTLDTSPAYLAMDIATRMFSPYDLDFGMPNPLAAILAESGGFRRAWPQAPIKLFITATNVHTGRAADLPQRRHHARRR